MIWIKFKSSYRIILTIVLLILISLSYILLARQQSRKIIFTNDKDYDDRLLKKCFYKAFRDSILVLNFNFPYYRTIRTIKDLYEGVFDRVITCGNPPNGFIVHKGPDIVFDVESGHFSYHCLSLAIEKYPNYKGYFYGNDDMIINWWTLVGLDQNKIWHGTKEIDWQQDAFGKILKPDWIWWKTGMGISACKNYYKTLKSLSLSRSPVFDAATALELYLRNGKGRPRCAKGWSDFFHIPGYLAENYRFLSHLAYNNSLYLEIAVHNILRSMTDINEIEIVSGLYMPDHGFQNYTSSAFWELYNHQLAFIHPYKFYTDDRYFSDSKLKTEVIYFKQKLTDCTVKDFDEVY